MYKFIEKFKNKMNKKQIYLIFILGVIVLIFSSLFNSSNPREKELETENEISTEFLEKKLEDILPQISGVGKVDVMITYDTSGEMIAVSNDKILTEESKESVDKEIVMKSNGSEKEPFISKEIKPVVRGVLVVAEGAEVQATKINLTKAVSSVLDVPINRVEVLPKNKEDKRWLCLKENK